MTKEYILNFLTTHKQELQNNYALTKIGLFGSYAKNTANENSDIDIVIQSTKKDFFLSLMFLLTTKRFMLFIQVLIKSIFTLKKKKSYCLLAN